MSKHDDIMKKVAAIETCLKWKEYLSQSHIPWLEGVDVTNTPFVKSDGGAKEVNMFLIRMLLNKT